MAALVLQAAKRRKLYNGTRLHFSLASPFTCSRPGSRPIGLALHVDESSIKEKEYFSGFTANAYHQFTTTEPDQIKAALHNPRPPVISMTLLNKEARVLPWAEREYAGYLVDARSEQHPPLLVVAAFSRAINSGAFGYKFISGTDAREYCSPMVRPHLAGQEALPSLCRYTAGNDGQRHSEEQLQWLTNLYEGAAGKSFSANEILAVAGIRNVPALSVVIKASENSTPVEKVSSCVNLVNSGINFIRHRELGHYLPLVAYDISHEQAAPALYGLATTPEEAQALIKKAAEETKALMVQINIRDYPFLRRKIIRLDEKLSSMPLTQDIRLLDTEHAALLPPNTSSRAGGPGGYNR